MHQKMSRSSLYYFPFHFVILGLTLLATLPRVGLGQDQTEVTSHENLERIPDKTLLITKEFPGETWTFFSGKKDAKFQDTWQYVMDEETGIPFISCTGQPYGYIRTRRAFQNFEFGLEWRFPHDENGNSGVLLFTNGDDRIWPTSLQVQLQQPIAGSAFPSGGAKSSNELRNIPMLSRPINQWNRCLVTSVDGTVTIVVNDQNVGTVKDCKPFQGGISLQSEGAEIHFRNIWIRELPNETESLSKSSLRRERRVLAAFQRN